MTEKFDKTFKDDYSHLYFGHGSVAFSILGEYSPSSSLVYAPPPLAPAELLCAKNWDGLSKFIENASHSFANKVIENEVSVLNMSGGDDRKSIREYFSEKCPNSRISSEEESVYLLIVSKFYSELERLSNIVVVQSAADGGNPDDFPIDCKIRNPSNRLRVHFIPDSANTVMPKEGAALYNSFAYLFGNERNPANECADLYLNAGVDNKGKFNRISLGSGTGFRFERLSFMVASWIAPLASAFIVSQKNAVFYGMNGEQIAKKILEPGTPAVYDPIGNRQLEAFEKKIMGEPL